MARLLDRHAYSVLPSVRTFNVLEFSYRALQVAIVGGITLFVLIAFVNSILGTGQPEPVYSSY
jgi:hypothetical protein